MINDKLVIDDRQLNDIKLGKWLSAYTHGVKGIKQFCSS